MSPTIDVRGGFGAEIGQIAMNRFESIQVGWGCIDPPLEIRLIFDRLRAAPSGEMAVLFIPRRRYGRVPSAADLKTSTSGT
jgi:hypothetical protein